MRMSSALAVVLLAAAARAQVLAPEEIPDLRLRGLQQKYFSQLKLITAAAAAHQFPYHFYFSRKLDLEEKDQKTNDQRSVQFDHYEGQVVLKITGNYFASYSAETMKPEERARKTYEDVMLPLLEAAVHALEKADVPQAFAFEVSHHVRKKVLGVSSESVENVVLVLPTGSASRLVASTDPLVRQAAVLEGESFLNAVPITFWPRSEDEIAQAKPSPTAAPAPTVSARLISGGGFPVVAAKATPPEKSPARDTSPGAISELQKSYQPNLDRMAQELDSQAHFVRYAPPAFIAFHNGLYLQLSLTTTLPHAAAGSQYRLAALAFDQHIARLIRPVLAYFKDRADFDGIDFSTTVRLPSSPGAEASSVAAEYLFPLDLLRTYADFDATGQQLIDSSFVLINGERVSLSLQAAEAAVQ